MFVLFIWIVFIDAVVHSFIVSDWIQDNREFEFQLGNKLFSFPPSGNANATVKSITEYAMSRIWPVRRDCLLYISISIGFFYTVGFEPALFFVGVIYLYVMEMLCRFFECLLLL